MSMENYESGYFTAGSIPVPAEFMDADGHVEFQQADPYRSFVQIVPIDGRPTYAIDFVGNDHGALLMWVPSRTEAEVRVLLALNTPVGQYQYRAYFYKERTNLIAYQHDGTLFVTDEPKEDCRYLTLGVINNLRSVNQDARLAICAECPFNLDGVCGECGCNIVHKTSAALESCPIGKWGPSV